MPETPKERAKRIAKETGDAAKARTPEGQEAARKVKREEQQATRRERFRLTPRPRKRS